MTTQKTEFDADLDRAIAKFQDTAYDIVKSVSVNCIKPIFDTYEFIENVSWTQYADYWNNGEPCYFSAPRGLYITVSGEEHHWEDLDSNDFVNFLSDLLGTASVMGIVASIYKMLRNLYSILEKCEDILRILGDNTKVVIRRSGAIVTLDYSDHD